MNYLKLKIKESSFTNEDLMNLLNLSRSTYYRKIKESSFTLKEIKTIRSLIDIEIEKVMEEI
ncbi:hypothetical protein EAI30_15960 [Romboutsia ilealis]|uniref:Uncharacterized protein n=1 Tax=Romboutsia faecis TaxID=2764597 RepID=A0ABR7JNC1_9FIRM|nr:hypothetical protein [Romboutsia faecis]MBC5996431.1 hypothetical protein [Romboutsia faecis]MRN26109.1 hypothetical protein [Romboutsia ilealis]